MKNGTAPRIPLARRMIWRLGRALTPSGGQYAWPICFGVAVGSVAVALLLRLGPLGGLGPLLAYVTLYPAVTISAAVAGYRAGLLAIALSAIGGTALLAPMRDEHAVLGIVAFLAGSLLIVAVTETARLALTRATMAEARASQARQRLEADHRLRWALRAARGGAWDWDMKTGVAWWSPEMYALWGVAPGTRMAFENSFALVHPEDRGRLSASVAAAIERGEEFRCAFRIRHGSLGERHMDSRGELIRDAAGAPARLIGLTIDRTESREAGIALARSEQHLRLLLEHAPSALAMFDREMRYLGVSRRWLGDYGLAGRDVIGQSHYEVFPEITEHWRAIHQRALAGETVIREEDRFERADGSVQWLRWEVRPWRDAAGRIAGIVIFTEDISDRMRAQEALRKFSRVIEQTANTVLITDAEGVIEYVNPAFTEITGYAVEEAIGKRPSLVKSGLTPDALYRGLWRTIKGGGVWKGELQNRRKDGTLFWESAIISPIRDAEGRITHFAGIKEDITRRKQDEVALAQARRLEAVGQLAGGVAHDFNNLLSVIVANLELIEPQVEGERARRMIRRALEAAETGVSFNRRLLSLARRRGLAPELLDLNLRAEETATLFEHTLGPDVALSLDLAPDLWPVRTDGAEIDSAILNLAMNARDAMPEGGRLVIRTANVTLDAAAGELAPEAPPGDYVRLTVTDTGRGMTPEVRERALEPFFTTKEPRRGTGLGLSSVFHFVRQSGGFLHLASAVGEGTTVSLYLPRAAAAPAPANAPRAEPEAPPLGTGELVLLVEDDSRVRQVARERLATLGYDVIEAASGPEALELLKGDDAIALVFTDIVMPGGMSGHDVAAWTRSHRRDVGLLLTSACDADDPEERRSRGRHAPRKLDKPHSLGDLARAVRDALDAVAGGAG